MVCRCSRQEILHVSALTGDLTNTLQLNTQKQHHKLMLTPHFLSGLNTQTGQFVIFSVYLFVKRVYLSLEPCRVVFVLLYHLLSLFQDLLKSAQLLLQGHNLLSPRWALLHLLCELKHTPQPHNDNIKCMLIVK